MRRLTQPLRLLGFASWFLWNMTTSTLTMARTIVAPPDPYRAVIAEVHTHCRNEAEVALLSVLVSLTPGTLVVATASTEGHGPWTLYVNDIFSQDSEAAREGIADLEARMLTAVRPDTRKETP